VTVNDHTSDPGLSAGPRVGGPPPASVSFFLISLGRRARDSVDDRLHEYGIAFHHLAALGHLSRQPGLSYSELARRAQVTVQSMQTTVAHLEQEGLVARGATNQGRRADLRVTEYGANVLAAAQAAIRSVDADLLNGFTASERAALETALFRLFTSSLPEH
jgi:DNA-binding MarR family transcriptional regulator